MIRKSAVGRGPKVDVGHLKEAFYQNAAQKTYNEVPSKDDQGGPALNGPKNTWLWPIPYRGIAGLVASLDFLLITGIGLLSSELYHRFILNSSGVLHRDIAISLFVALIFVGIFRLQKLYSAAHLLLWNVQINHVTWIWCATFFMMSGWLFLWKTGDDVSRGAILSFWGLGFILLLFHRAFWRFYLEQAIKAGSLRGRKIIVVARNSAMESNLKKNLGRHGYDIKSEFIIRGDSSSGEIDIDLANVVSSVRGSQIEEVLLLVKDEDLSELHLIIDRLRILPIPVTWIADGKIAQLVRQPWFELGSGVAVEMQRSPRSRPERIFKRIVDIVGASCGLLVFLPLLLVVAIVIKIDSSGPIFFWQTRRGFNGKPFKILKFRTMKVLEDGDVVKQAKKNDVRVTNVGRWLRKTSIDELPQLYNVVISEMSLVGPRPHAVVHDDSFLETVADYAYRNHVKPGITGWAQVHGFRGETSTLHAIERRVEFDRWYINNWSIWLDFLIMLRTVGGIMHSRNAY